MLDEPRSVPVLPLVIAALAACTAPPEPPPPAVRAATPEPGPPPAAAAPIPPGPPRDELHVAVEGFCDDLRLEVVGDDVFVRAADGRVARLGEGGPVPLPALRVGAAAAAVEALYGRGRDELFAGWSAGGGLADALLRLDGARWAAVPGFARGSPIREAAAWTDGRLLVHVLADRGAGLRDELRVVGGRGGPPDLGPLERSCAAAPSFSHPTVDRLGNLALAWDCGLDPRVAIWPAGGGAPRSHPVAMQPEPGPFVVAADQRGGFFVAYRSRVVARVDVDGARVLAVPDGDWLQHLAVDADGRLWLAYNEAVHRQTADGWAQERVPGAGFIEQLVGVERGAPWLRRGGSTYVHGLQLRDDEQVYARDPDGSWRTIAPARGVLRPGEALHVDLLRAGAGGLWMTAHGRARLARPGGDPRPYLAVVTDVAVREPLRCSDERGEPVAW